MDAGPEWTEKEGSTKRAPAVGPNNIWWDGCWSDLGLMVAFGPDTGPI